MLLASSVSLAIAEEIAPNFTLTDIDGIDFSLSDYRGKVVLLDFFATSCGTCRAEISRLRVLHEEFGDDLVIISVSIVPLSDTVESLRQFREDYEMDWIVARDTNGVSWSYGVTSTATRVIIDQEGYIQHRHVGITDESVLQDEIYEIMSEFGTDLNKDGRVDIRDMTIVAMAFGSEPGDENWNIIADLNDDEVIDIRDITIVALEFGKTV